MWKAEYSWAIPAGLWNVYDENGNRVAKDLTRDRAHLIAKAPEMLEALKPFAEKCPDDAGLVGKSPDHPVPITVRRKYLTRARALIAELGDDE